MPILDMQLRMRELGRIRTGEQVAAGRGKRPAKLEHFRLTTASKELLDAAAEIYGGTVVPWESPAGAEWELKTKTDVLPVVIPPGEALSQWYELWSGGGCQRRCDGHIDYVSDVPCQCPADPADRREAAQAGEACKPTTRLNVILPDLPDLGVWRLESHGYYAAVELAGAARFLAIASSSGLNIPARLRLDQREKKVPGKPTNRYAVPIIEFTTTRITDLLAAGGTGAPQLTPPATAQLAASTVGPTVDPGPAPRQAKTERPPLGDQPALPDGSTFRKPAAAAPAAQPPATNGHAAPAPETVAGWQVAEAPPESTPAFMTGEPASEHPLATAIRGQESEGGRQGLPTKPLLDKLRALFMSNGIAGGAATAGLKAIWPDVNVNALSANQANAILVAADSDPDFAAHWAQLAAPPVTA